MEPRPFPQRLLLQENLLLMSPNGDDLRSQRVFGEGLLGKLMRSVQVRKHNGNIC